MNTKDILKKVQDHKISVAKGCELINIQFLISESEKALLEHLKSLDRSDKFSIGSAMVEDIIRFIDEGRFLSTGIQGVRKCAIEMIMDIWKQKTTSKIKGGK